MTPVSEPAPVPYSYGPTYHIIHDDTRQTLCGKDGSEWADLDATAEHVAGHANCCSACRGAFRESEQ